LTGYGLVALGRHPHTNWRGALSAADEAQIRWAVAAVGAEDIAARPVMQVSDGQRQKLMIARALAQESPVILLDEPTAFLDWPRRVEMMKLLKDLAHQTGRAILLSTHDLDLAIRAADELWVMAAGDLRRACPDELSQSQILAWAFGPEGAYFDARR
jgi:iron complex transport system ATP-binding protein